VRFASPQLQKLGRKLLALEAAGETGTAKDRAFRVCEKLRQPLTALTGIAGFRALLSRALALASREVPWLKAIRVNAQGSPEGFDEICTTLSTEEIAQGEALLIARLTWLLITFIGQALTLRLIQDVWPQISGRDLNSEMESDNG
jgi:hypothetical protein